MNKKNLFLMSIWGLSINLYSQTAIENLEKYWNYRDRFKKYFIKIGTGDGESILAQERCTKSIPNPFGLSCGCNASGDIANVKWADATVWTGYYLAVLASEYALLKQNGQDTKNTLNEIYYVLNAINRLDFNAEFYLSKKAKPHNMNGFLLRDDVPKDFHKSASHWASEYDCMSSSAWDYSSAEPNHFNANDEMSQDQVLSLFVGLALVNKLVDNMLVKPTPQDQGFKIVDETRAIVHRIMNYITSEKSYSGTDLVFKDDADITSRWQIVNPVTNKLVHAGGDVVFGFAGALSTSANKITGQFYDFPLFYDAFFGAFSLKNYNISVPPLIARDWFAKLQNVDFLALKPLSGKIEFCLLKSSIIKICEERDFSNLTADFNLSMIFEMAALSGLWSHTNLANQVNANKMYIFDLIYSALNNVQPKISRQLYEGLMNTAPCTGPNTKDPNGWFKHNIFLHPSKTPQTINQAERDRNDYMLLYNLYHLLYQNQTQLPEYKDVSCQCYPGNTITAGVINFQQDVVGKFPQYQNFGLRLPEFLNDNAAVTTSTGQLNVYTDLILCKNAVLTVTNGGKSNCGSVLPSQPKGNISARSGSKFIISSNGQGIVNNGSSIIVQDGGQLIIQAGGILDIKSNALIKIESGAQLIIEGGGLLQVENSGLVKIESGAQFIAKGNGTLQVKDGGIARIEKGGILDYQNGADIQLLGNNAVLDIAGTLQIGNDATFTFSYPHSTSGYVNFSSSNKILAGTNSSIIFVGADNQDVVLAGGLVSPPDSLVQFRLVTGASSGALIRLGCWYIFNNARFINGGGISVYGQPGTINNCIFNSASAGGSLFEKSPNRIVMTNCTFNEGGLSTSGAEQFFIM